MGVSSSSNPTERERESRRSRGSSLSISLQTIEQLQAECEELQIPYPSNASREELIELLVTARNKRRQSFWKTASDGYEELVKAIIRPPRAEYSLNALGRKNFIIDGVQFERHDFELLNKRNLKLQCSWWRPKEINGIAPIVPCCVYLHGNSSCRLEATEALPAVLSAQISMFAFDFSGSGKSDGEYVSLGFFEREDLDVVIRYLRESNRVSTIGLWGRSMVGFFLFSPRC